MTEHVHRIGALIAVVGFSLAVMASPADASTAASPPTAVTGPPSALAVTAVTFSGDVDPDGVSTKWRFEYGTTVNYGLSTAVGSAGATASLMGVAIRVGGLTPGTTYHYRLVASSDGGTAYGSDATVRTPERSPSIEKTAVAATGDTGAEITAEIDPNGLSATWYLQYVTAASFAGSGVFDAATSVRAVGSGIDPTTVTATIANLSPHVGYLVQVVTKNAVGTRVGPKEAFVTTGPPLVTGETVGALSPTAATISGDVDPDGHSTSWYVQYGTTTSYGADTPKSDAGASMTPRLVSRSLSGLVPNTTYHFRVVARSAVGTAVGADSAFTTPGPTLAASTGIVDFGHGATLSGAVPTPSANQVVSIYAEPFPNASFVEVATVLTGAGGTWAFATEPQIGVTYKAIWKDEVSPPVTIGVSPSVTLRVRPNGRFVTRVAGASSFVGRVVRLQRLDRGVWRTVSVRRLNHDSAAAFRARLPSGRSQLRVYLSRYQAGAGYLAATSAVHRSLRK